MKKPQMPEPTSALAVSKNAQLKQIRFAAILNAAMEKFWRLI
jgi:hypothetical protein